MTLYHIQHGSRVITTTDTYMATQASRHGARVTARLEAGQ